MKTFIAKAGTTIARPNQNTSSNFSGFRAMGLLLIAWMTSGFCGQGVYCQGTVQKPLSDFFHGTHFIKMSGDTMMFEFVVGSEDVPATDVVGFEFNTSFPTLNEAPSQVFVNVAGTWVAADGGSTNVNSEWDGHLSQLQVAYLRGNSSTQTGHGRAAKISLVRPGGFASSEAIMKLGGGLMIVDNVDLRMGQSPGDEASNGNVIEVLAPADADPIGDGLLVYPDSDPNLLHVDVANPEGCKLRLTTLGGVVVRQQPCMASQKLDLNGLAAGIYIVSIQSEKRFVSQKVFIR